MSKPIILPVSENIVSEPLAETFAQIEKTLGNVSNIFRTVAHSPAALRSLLSQVIAVEGMGLSGRINSAIGLRVSQLNCCTYCLAANTVSSERFGVDAATARGFRRGQSNDPKEQALLALVTKVVKDHGHHAGFVIETARRMGVTEAEIIEATALIALHTFTNYVNNVANTHLDPHLSEVTVEPLDVPDTDCAGVIGNDHFKEDGSC